MKLESARAQIDFGRRVRSVRGDRFRLAAARAWYRLYTPYVPMDTGRLARDVRIAPGVIEHLAPYARRVYRGRNMSFRRDRHPLASAAWDRAAEPAQKPKLIRELQAFVDGGGIALGG